MLPKFPVGFRAWCVALALSAGAIAHAAEQHPLMGATREQVLNRYGEPKSTLVAGSRELLFYPRERLVLREGVVVDVERVAVEPVRRPVPPAPAPVTETPTASAPAPVAAEVTPAQKATNETAGDTRSVAPNESSVTSSTQAEENAPPPPPPEPRLEIKRVLPPGSSTVRTAPKTSTQAAPAKAAAPDTAKSTPPASVVPAGPDSVPTTAAPLASVTSTPSAATTPTPQSAGTETAPALASAPSVVAAAPATEQVPDVEAKKEDAKKEAEIRAARRRLDEAKTEAADPTASFFTTRTYLYAFLLIGGGIGYLAWRRRQRQLLLAATAVSRTPFNVPVAAGGGVIFNSELLSKLEWKRFEELVASYYSKTGVVATRTKSGPSTPVHIKISWKGEPRPFALVQCIAQPQGLIDVQPVQELFNVLTAEDIRRGYVVTTGRFSVSARDFAEEKHITLLPGDIFLEKLNALPDAARAELMSGVTAGDFKTPSCPKCEAKMMRSPDDPTLWRCASHPDQEMVARR